ncbi:Putative niacin/nicotinamide transporter NaiP [Pseudomonas aeruginosa]|nr:Putative niacin/nicotinamide transporter NaiP [Pseudomonas aeruginosa]
MNATALSPNPAPAISRRTMLIAFVFCFLGLLADGVDLMFLAYSLNSLKAEFGLSNFEAGSLGSLTLAGMAVGGIYGGWCCDRFGRVRVVTWTIVLFSIGTALLGLTQNYWQFALIRFVASLGLGSLFVACNILMSECVGTRYRTTILAAMQAGWTVGYLVATLLAGQIIPEFGWRTLFFTAVAPALVCLALRPWVPESPSWLAAQAGRQRPGAAPQSHAEAGGAGPLGRMLGDPETRGMFLLWSLTSCFLLFGYYGTNNWMPSYLESELGMNFKSMTGYMVGTYSAMILGKVAAGVCADLFGRRLTFAAGAIGSAAFMPLIVFYHSPSNILWILITFGFIYGVPVGVLATYMTESFSTRVRGSAVGTAYNLGRIGAARRHRPAGHPRVDRRGFPGDGHHLRAHRTDPSAVHCGPALRPEPRVPRCRERFPTASAGQCRGYRRAARGQGLILRKECTSMSSFPRQPAAEQRPASFQEFIGLERWTDADGVARVRLGHRPELMNYLQQFHGGVLMSVLDAAMAQAIRACLPDCSMVTIDMATHFMGSARGELRAVGRVVRRTRTICFCTAEICNEDGEVIAMASGSFRYRAAKP